MLTLKEVQDSVPAGSKGNITQAMVDQLNNLSTDPEVAKYIQDNFITFSNVLQEGRYRMGDYIRAIMYVTHKMRGLTNREAYAEALPQRYNRMVSEGMADKDINSNISAYNKGDLVNKVMERAIIPSWILNQDFFQKALQTQHDLMMDVTVSDKVRCEAANSLLTHLKKPENNKAELKIDIAVNDGMVALERSLQDLSQSQLRQIQHNPSMSVNDIARAPLAIDIEAEEVS